MRIHSLILFALIYIVSAQNPLRAPKFEGNVKWISALCVKQTNLDVTKPYKGNKDTADVTHEHKCYMRCVSNKMGLIDNSGETNFEKVRTVFRLSDGELESFKKCLETTQYVDECERTFEMILCVERSFKH